MTTPAARTAGPRGRSGKADNPSNPGNPGNTGNTLTGAVALLRFMLRRDRIRFPAWTLGLALLATYFATAIKTLFPSPAELEAFAAFWSNPAGALFMGPASPGQPITTAQVLGGVYGLYLMVGGALMTILTVTRHTRAEEQLGRGELLRAAVVGRHAQLTAALGLAGLMSLAVASLTGGAMIGLGYDAAGAFALGASVGAAGLAFAGLQAICVQISQFSRATAGIGGAALGLGFLVRGIGDISVSQGGQLGWLSWLTPLGWSQKSEPLTGNHWAPLGWSAVCLVICAVVGYRLSSRRDLGAGLVAARLGAGDAAGWISGPFPVALRLQRGSLIGWGTALFLTALTYGALAGMVRDGMTNGSPEMLKILGSADGIVDGFVGLMGFFFAIMVTIFAILATQGLKAEEEAGRGAAILATAVGRPGWLGSWTGVAAIGVVGLMALTGLGSGIGAAVSTGTGQLLGQGLVGHLAQIPAVGILLALAAMLYAISARLVALSWAPMVYAAIVGILGPLANLPNWMMKLSPFEHIGRYPGGHLSVTAITLETAIAVVLTAAALAIFRRRNIYST